MMRNQRLSLFVAAAIAALAAPAALAQDADAADAAAADAYDAAQAAADAAEVAAAEAAMFEVPFVGAVIDGLPTPPVLENYPDLYTISALDHYPAAARAELREGTAHVAVDIDAKGMVTACRLVESSGHDDLDAASCTKLRELGQFAAARDREDRPVEGRVTVEVNWHIPKQDNWAAVGADPGDGADVAVEAPDPETLARLQDGFEPPKENAPGQMLHGSGSLTAELMVDENGGVVSCTITTEGVMEKAFQDGKNSPCDRPPRLDPYRDDNGNPVKKRVRLKIAVEVDPAPGQ
jgi:TonB family protein